MKETTNTSQETELIEVVAAKESNDKDEPKTVYGKINDGNTVFLTESNKTTKSTPEKVSIDICEEIDSSLLNVSVLGKSKSKRRRGDYFEDFTSNVKPEQEEINYKIS